MVAVPAGAARLQVVLASNNAKKLVELRELFAPLDLELVAQGSLDIGEAEEPFATFIENALAKARHAARASGRAALADDSGLCVDALGGAPGVHSARFADAVVSDGDRESQRAAQDAANNRLLLERLAGASDRRARFVGVLVAVRHADDPEPLVAVGRWPAQILDAPRGAAGFGYDPLVLITEFGRSVAELAPAVKNRSSHRARAAAVMRELMVDAWQVGPAVVPEPSAAPAVLAADVRAEPQHEGTLRADARTDRATPEDPTR